MLLVETHGKIVGYLSTCADDYSRRILEFDDVHHTLKGEFVEVETVAHIIVSRYRLWIIVDHHRAVALLANGVKSLHTTPVELNRRTDAICTRTEYDD